MAARKGDPSLCGFIHAHVLDAAQILRARCRGRLDGDVDRYVDLVDLPTHRVLPVHRNARGGDERRRGRAGQHQRRRCVQRRPAIEQQRPPGVLWIHIAFSFFLPLCSTCVITFYNIDRQSHLERVESLGYTENETS